MMLNSRAIAIIIALLVAGISTAFLSLVPEINQTALWITFLMSGASTFLMVRMMVEFIFIREIKKIHNALSKIKDKDLSFISDNKGSFINPMKRINRDIFLYASRKQREIEQLRKIESFRREFIADISHELKTPIFAAQGFLHTLLDGAEKEKKVRHKFLKKAAKSLDRLDILVHDLLTISQIETGDIRMHYEVFDMTDLCREVVDQLEDKAEKREVNLIFENKSKQAIFVSADYQRIYQVMINLAMNGINYTKKDGNIIIRLSEEDEKLKVIVEDNGRGIPDEDIQRIFERFYRVDKSRSKEKGGTGLGLSIVKHILEGHNTKIEVKSELGKGSVFWFYLELAEEQLSIAY